MGTSISFLRGYAQASAGYRAREGNAPNEWMADAEVGWVLPGPLSARVRYELVPTTSAEFSKLFRSETEKWAKVVREAKIPQQ